MEEDIIYAELNYCQCERSMFLFKNLNNPNIKLATIIVITYLFFYIHKVVFANPLDCTNQSGIWV